GMERWVFGSVAEKVVRLAECPVLTVRQGKGDLIRCLRFAPAGSRAFARVAGVSPYGAQVFRLAFPGLTSLLRNTSRDPEVMRRCPRGSEGIFHGVHPGRGAGADHDVSRDLGRVDPG